MKNEVNTNFTPEIIFTRAVVYKKTFRGFKMSENSFIWTCNRSKYLEILSAVDVYWENIGNRSNSTWYLKIKLSKVHDKYALKKLESFSFLLDFYLLRLEGGDELDVTVRCIQKTKILFEKTLHFNFNKLDQYIGEFNTKEDYELDIVFIFPENNDSLNDFSDSYVPDEDDDDHEVEVNKVSDVDDNLKSDLLSLFHSEYMADVTLKCGSESLKAHKTILGARSPVFKTMFANEMQESNTGTVTICDMDTAVFQAWVYFLYGGQVKVTSVNFASGLLYVAEKYQMEGLKEVCIRYLKSALSTENAIRILQIADLYDAELKNCVLSYASDNFNDLKDSKDWCDLKSKNPVLALEIYSFGEKS